MRQRGLILLYFSLCLIAPAVADDFQAYCAATADAGARQVISQGPAAGLISGPADQPDVAFITPAWALSCLLSSRHLPEANAALRKVASLVASSGETAGLLPWQPSGEPTLAATEVAAPVLAACLLWAPERLEANTKSSLSSALARMGKALARARPEDVDLRTLLLSAACAAVGRATDDRRLLNRAENLLEQWLDSARLHGLPDGHGPTVEATRLSAVQWLTLFVPSARNLDQARRLLWADLLQRLFTPSRFLAGAQLFSSPGDARGRGPMASILSVLSDLDADPLLDHLCYVLPFRGASLPLPDPPRPTSLRYTWSTSPLVEEDTLVTDAFAIGTQTAPLNASSVPLHIIWQRPSPFATFATVSAPCHVASVRNGSMTLLNFDFDGVGRGDRVRTWVDIHIAPLSLVRDVRVVDQRWPGQPVAIDVGVPVAVSFGDCYLGLVPCWAGPVQAKKVTMRVKPGVLQWSEPGENSELLLRLYARQADYPLRRPQNNFVVGFIAVAASAADADFDVFCRSIRFIRQRHYARERKWRVPEKDEGHPILDRWKPKPKRAYAVERALDYTIELRVAGKTWLITEDVYREEVLKRVAAGQPVAPSTLMFDTPWLKLPPRWKTIDLPAELSALLSNLVPHH